MLPEDQGLKLRYLWDEFEKGESPEAKFAIVMDRIQPMMLNATSNGKLWKERNIKLSQILDKNRDVPTGSNALWEFAYKSFIQPNVDTGNIINE